MEKSQRSKKMERRSVFRDKKLSNVEVLALPDLISTFSAISIKTQVSSSVDTDKLNIEFIGKGQIP
jgi:hypothetical protein